jgi:hypothetical protein
MAIVRNTAYLKPMGSVGLFYGGGCTRCTREYLEALRREYAEKSASKTYLDKLLEEFHQ